MLSEDDIAKVFKALCDPIRINILKILQKHERCACELGKSLDIAQSKLSYHMKILCESGIVDSWNVGKWTHYKISLEGSKQAKKILNDILN